VEDIFYGRCSDSGFPSSTMYRVRRVLPPPPVSRKLARLFFPIVSCFFMVSIPPFVPLVFFEGPPPLFLDRLWTRLRRCVPALVPCDLNFLLRLHFPPFFPSFALLLLLPLLLFSPIMKANRIERLFSSCVPGGWRALRGFPPLEERRSLCLPMTLALRVVSPERTNSSLPS